MDMTFDLITLFILGAAIINVIMFVWAKIKIKQLDEIVHPKSDRRMGQQADMSITDDDCADLNKASAVASRLYTLYTNITAIFPLLGIFGTVVSLMKLSGTEGIADNFSMALTTTFWGLIFAIIFKILDSFISSTLDRALDEADYLIHEHDNEKRKSYAPQTETGYRY